MSAAMGIRDASVDIRNPSRVHVRVVLSGMVPVLGCGAIFIFIFPFPLQGLNGGSI